MKHLFGIEVRRKTRADSRIARANVVFFSFSETDRAFVLALKTKAMNPKYHHLNFLVQDLMKRWSTENPTFIRKTVEKCIKDATRTIVFIGKDTHRSHWVSEEVNATRETGKSVYAIRVKDTHGVKPAFLLKHNIHLYPWHEANLQYLATRED